MTAIDWTARLAAVAPPGGGTIMEVCGTHTMTARRAGLHALWPEGVRLLAGPGCPVCVTPVGYVDHAVALALTPGVIVTTFGDLLRVPGSTTSLERARAEGADVRVVYSPIDALWLARTERNSIVVFLGVGFETTAPTTAAAIVEAAAEGLESFTVLSAHRLVPPALDALLAREDELHIDGFLAPGHVSAIIGTAPYEPVARDARRPVVVAGFEPEDMLVGVEMILRQLTEGWAVVENNYRSVVRPEGNPVARALVERVFETVDSTWRGLGSLPASGLAIVDELSTHDAARRVEVEIEPPREPKGCRCGQVLTGALLPEQCPLFRATCSPANPVGACMVSSEGACAAAFRYGR